MRSRRASRRNSPNAPTATPSRSARDSRTGAAKNRASLEFSSNTLFERSLTERRADSFLGHPHAARHANAADRQRGRVSAAVLGRRGAGRMVRAVAAVALIRDLAAPHLLLPSWMYLAHFLR